MKKAAEWAMTSSIAYSLATAIRPYDNPAFICLIILGCFTYLVALTIYLSI